MANSGAGGGAGQTAAPRSLRHLSVYLSGLVRGRLWLKVLVGMGLGLVVGTLLGPSVGLVSPATGTAILPQALLGLLPENPLGTRCCRRWVCLRQALR